MRWFCVKIENTLQAGEQTARSHVWNGERKWFKARRPFSDHYTGIYKQLGAENLMRYLGEELEMRIFSRYELVRPCISL
jgi:hypothetical protein